MSMTMSFAPLLNHLRLLTATPTPESDAALLGRFVSGDEAAFNELLGRHGPMPHQVSMWITGLKRSPLRSDLPAVAPRPAETRPAS